MDGQAGQSTMPIAEGYAGAPGESRMNSEFFGKTYGHSRPFVGEPSCSPATAIWSRLMAEAICNGAWQPPAGYGSRENVLSASFVTFARAVQSMMLVGLT